jgi:hypothetical protein
VTSTLYRTTEHTIIQCAMAAVNCPASYASEVIVTETVDVYTTVCPVSASVTPPASWYTTTAASTDAAATTTTAPSLDTAKPVTSYSAHLVTDLITLVAVPTPIVNTFCTTATTPPTLASGPAITVVVVSSSSSSSSSVVAVTATAAESTHVHAAPSASGHFYLVGNNKAAPGHSRHASGSGKTHLPTGTGAGYPVAQNTHHEAAYETSATASYSSKTTSSSPVTTAGAGKVAAGVSGLVGAGVVLIAFL